MFDELLNYYQNLPLNSKREKILEELKLVIAALQLLCDQHHLKYGDFVVDDIIDFENDDEFLKVLYAYVLSLKESLGEYVLENEKKD